MKHNQTVNTAVHTECEVFVCCCVQASIMTGTAISLGVDGVSKPPAEPILGHSRMSPLRRNSLLHQGNLLHQTTHLHQGGHLHEEAHLHDEAQFHEGNPMANVRCRTV